MKKTKNSINFVAEVGCNHQGNMRLALKMIDKLVNFCDVKYVKFQKRNNRELLGKASFSASIGTSEGISLDGSVGYAVGGNFTINGISALQQLP